MSKRDVPKLNRDNFPTWKSMMKLHLRGLGDHVKSIFLSINDRIPVQLRTIIFLILVLFKQIHCMFFAIMIGREVFLLYVPKHLQTKFLQQNSIGCLNAPPFVIHSMVTPQWTIPTVSPSSPRPSLRHQHQYNDSFEHMEP